MNDIDYCRKWTPIRIIQPAASDLQLHKGRPAGKRGIVFYIRGVVRGYSVTWILGIWVSAHCELAVTPRWPHPCAGQAGGMSVGVEQVEEKCNCSLVHGAVLLFN